LNTETGEIVSQDQIPEDQKTKYKILPAYTYVRPGDKVGRNDPCPCMFGKKFKRCCQTIQETAEREVRKLHRVTVITK